MTSKALNTLAAVAQFILFMFPVLFVSFCIWSIFDCAAGHIAAVLFLTVETLAVGYLSALRLSGRL